MRLQLYHDKWLARIRDEPDCDITAGVGPSMTWKEIIASCSVYVGAGWVESSYQAQNPPRFAECPECGNPDDLESPNGTQKL